MFCVRFIVLDYVESVLMTDRNLPILGEIGDGWWHWIPGRDKLDMEFRASLQDLCSGAWEPRSTGLLTESLVSRGSHLQRFVDC